MTNDDIFDIFSAGHDSLTKACVISAMKQARLDERFAMCHEIQGACMNGDLDDKCEDVVNLLLRSKEC